MTKQTLSKFEKIPLQIEGERRDIFDHFLALADGVAGDVGHEPVDELVGQQLLDPIVDDQDCVEGVVVIDGPAHLGSGRQEA